MANENWRKLSNADFIKYYQAIINFRFPTKAEQIRYKVILKHRTKISKQDFDQLMARLAVYDNKIRRKPKSKQPKIDEDNQVDWQAIETKVIEKKQTFKVPISVDGDEMAFEVTAFNFTYAKMLAIQAAHEIGAETVRVIN